MSETIDDLAELYKNTKTCARIVGLHYTQEDDEGIRRHKHARGFRYTDKSDVAVVDAVLKERITGLVIPPAWHDVWICPHENGHILATGIDEKGRKQYIYHPKWRTVRDLIKFYRMILFARSLPKIRKAINHQLMPDKMTRDSILATMLWILDNAYIRIGNEAYYEQNDSVGLTTLTDKNIVIAGSVITFAFKGKSGKQQQITCDNTEIAQLLSKLLKVKGDRLFRYQNDDGIWCPIEAADINNELQALTGVSLSAKDFRTWGGTLMAYLELIRRHETDKSHTTKAVVAAVDKAAAVLGNTRSIARGSYVHPHLLEAYTAHTFSKYYETSKKKRKLPGLDTHESELLYFLESLFDHEFALVQN